MHRAVVPVATLIGAFFSPAFAPAFAPAPAPAAPQASGPLDPAAIFSDHMILPRDTAAPVFGSAAPGAEVSIRGSWMDVALTTRADASGFFRIDVPTGPAGGPHSLEISSGAERVRLVDVLFGDVWLASGQSNMQWTMDQVRPPGKNDEDWEKELEGFAIPNVRLFDVTRELSATPRRGGSGSWSRSSAEGARSFSAVALHFGRELYQDLSIPIGLVGCKWGGTVAEAWVSEEGLRDFEEFSETIRSLDEKDGGASAAEKYRAAAEAWWQKVETEEAPAANAAPGVDLSAWPTWDLPRAWAGTDFADHDGVAWFIRDITVPDGWVGSDLELRLGPIDDMDTTYWNGQSIGGVDAMGRWQDARRYLVPGASVGVGTSRVAVRVVDTGGEGGLVAGEDGELTLRAVGDRVEEPLSLNGPWRVRKGTDMGALGAFPARRRIHQNIPTVLSNAMVNPLVPFGFRGAIWYQGESNVGRAAQYRHLFPALIADWRRRFERPEMPFYFVQIAPYQYGDDRGAAADLRDAQRLSESVPFTGMAVTMDIGDPRDIHPKNKRDVGRRLALLALAKTYCRNDLECHGPLYCGMKVDGSKATLFFNYADGLASDGTPSHFQIAGSDRVFHPAEARIDGETMVVWSRAVHAPVAVRFAFGAADQPSLYNRAGLPASSFRTDDWPIE